MSPNVKQPDPRRPGRSLAGKSDARLAGVYRGIVRDNQDPQQLGRVRVEVPDVVELQGRGGAWARVAVPRAHAQRGTWFVPDVDEEVLVAFEAGDPNHPCVLGSLWSTSHAPPEQMTAGNPVTSIVSAEGARITLDDRPDQATVRLETAGGRRVTLRDGDATIVIADSSGGTIRLTPSGVEIRTPGTVKVTASTVEIAATVVTVNAGMTKASGTLQCNTLIADSVVASSYTPGAGNVW